jgi:pyrimidine deaminase RibD-like protein
MDNSWDYNEGRSELRMGKALRDGYRDKVFLMTKIDGRSRREAARQLGTERLTDCDLYVTLEPCTMCAAAISFARIRRLYFGAPDPKGGGVESGVRFFASPTCHHAPEVYSAVGESESATLLREFFKARR